MNFEFPAGSRGGEASLTSRLAVVVFELSKVFHAFQRWSTRVCLFSSLQANNIKSTRVCLSNDSIPNLESNTSNY